ncbi:MULTISPECIES: hypothetical protein [unclassified Yoonia]|uniref:hypothetical protein n=1 Tax=unclassified Yoonia TaxID=2629118 RepID=UPI002B000495|nr:MULTISPECIES: hypothetical protein [unclassified Yoonia]
MSHLMPSFAVALCLAVAGQAAAAQDYSAQFGELGISGTVDALAAIQNPSASDRFALGGALFLQAIETTFQERYRVGLGDSFINLPGLSTNLAINPDPDPFTADVIINLFTQLGARMDRAQETLAPITSDDTVLVRMDFNQIWFDINANGTRDANEDLLPIMVPLFVPAWRVDETLADFAAAGGAPTINFDTSDVAWLQAYTHVFSGTAEMVMAFDPTDIIAEVQSNATAIVEMRNGPGPAFFLSQEDETIADLVTIVLKVLEQEPDATHTRAALADFRAMIAHNLVFWDRVRAETDNKMEFIPNASQVSALGLVFPQNIDTAWQAVLMDVSQVLEGTLLIPHWRTGENIGINLNKWLQNPSALDVIGVIAGSDLAPYMERGPLASAEAMNEFSSATGGNFALFAFTLN